MTSTEEEITIVVTSKTKKWAYDNGYTLIFLSIMFIITWVIGLLGWLN